MYSQWSSVVLYFAFFCFAAFAVCSGAGNHADAHGTRGERKGLEAFCRDREHAKSEESISPSTLGISSAGAHDQDFLSICRDYSTSVGSSSRVSSDAHQLRTRDTAKNDKFGVRKRGNKGLTRRMIHDTSMTYEYRTPIKDVSPMKHDLSKMSRKEIASMEKKWLDRSRNFRQTSLPYKSAVDVARTNHLPAQMVVSSYLAAKRKLEEIFAEEVESLSRVGRMRDALSYQRATNTYVQAMLAHEGSIFVDARRERAKQPGSPKSASKSPTDGDNHRRQNEKKRLVRRMWISKEIERKAKHMENVAQNFKELSGSYDTAIDWVRSGKWPESKIKAAYLAAGALRARDLDQEVERLRLTGRTPDAARIREAGDKYLDAWQRSWATIMADASEGKTTHVTPSTAGEPGGKSSGSMLRRTLKD
ncbi:hypothetical protein MMC10_004840 [Thelotrema lepadinum]|nr:hypothetical protein [Thelotrema lepadinum]